jgi:predicted metal-dependent phosphoesterase TrpH
VYTPRLGRYAGQRNVLLLPAVEKLIDGKHVLLLNPDEEQAAAQSFAELRRLGRRQAAVVAPHPFYPTKTSLHDALAANIDLFDAIEFCNLYYASLNFNRKALRQAHRCGLPMVGTSDTHAMPYSDSTFTWIHAHPTTDDVIAAIRKGRVRLETKPRPALHALNMMRFAFQQTGRDLAAALAPEESSSP